MEAYNGILNVLKPTDMTSFDVVAYLRGVLKTRKIGHTGTLDPGVTGVLPICIGTATRAIEYITDRDKLYRAELTLGVETDTQDSTGQVVAIKKVDAGKNQILNAINSFVGKYNQIPPMFSAVKVNGQKLYDLARKGISVERKPREVEIYSINVLKIEEDENPKVLFDVHCSKGTYIRTICHDIGEKLGSGGHMSFLMRAKAGVLGIEEAITLEEIAEMVARNRLEEKLVKVDEVFRDYGIYTLQKKDEKAFNNGVFIKLEQKEDALGQFLRVYNSYGEFLALGEIIKRDNVLYLKTKKRF